MKKQCLIFVLAILCSLLSQGDVVQAASGLALKAQLTPKQMTPISEQIQKQLQTLVGTSVLAPVGDDSEDNNAEPAPTIGVRALGFVIAAADLIKSQGEIFITNFAALPQLSDWLDLQEHDHKLLGRWQAVGQDLINCVLMPLLGASLVELLLFPLRLKLRRRHPATFSGRLAVVLALFSLRAIPIAGFIAASVTLLNMDEAQKLPRFILFNIIYAFTISRILITLFRGFLAPQVGALRLAPMTTSQASYSYRWLSSFTIIVVISYFLRDIVQVIHVPEEVTAAFGDLLGLLLVLMMIIVIVQKRAFVTSLLRGNLSAAQSGLTLFQSLRLWFARRWHILTVTYLVMGYVVAASGVANGLIVMLRGTILTFLILVLVRISLNLVDRWGAWLIRDRDTARHPLLCSALRGIIWILGVMGVLAAWGADIVAFFDTPFGQRILGSLFSIGSAVIISTVLYEILSSAIDRHLRHVAKAEDSFRANARVRTVLPMFRNILLIIFASIVALVVLSEMGINVLPLLAGAGVLGVAVGFGSQALVKDLLTGFFIVIENTIAIGDVVKIGDNAGVVESLGFRSVRLRDDQGALHALPFGEVSKITNMTRDFGFAVIEVGVAYNTDLVQAMAVMRQIADELRKDPDFERVIIDAFEMWGVDKFSDSAITLKGRIKTLPGAHWSVRREYLLRLKQCFDKEGIVIPYPTVVQIVQAGKDVP
jgi:small conductance mechanosensitive channel